MALNLHVSNDVHAWVHKEPGFQSEMRIQKNEIDEKKAFFNKFSLVFSITLPIHTINNVFNGRPFMLKYFHECNVLTKI